MFELHVFVDARKEATAAVAHVVQDAAEQKYVSLIGSKIKIGPNKSISVPRTELQGAILGKHSPQQSSLEGRDDVEWYGKR